MTHRSISLVWLSCFSQCNLLKLHHCVRELGAEQADKELTRENPTIAIITNLLCEKMAVDAMIAHKTTYTRYKTEGESHVYTIGQLGRHKVVSTKLSVVGRERGASISSSSITTRMLGTFQTIQHVLLVGVAGGVQQVHDLSRHSRLGDVVVSAPASADPLSRGEARPGQPSPFYVFCDRLLQPGKADASAPCSTAATDFEHSDFVAGDFTLLTAARSVARAHLLNEAAPPRWTEQIQECIRQFNEEPNDISFTMPPADTNKVTYHGTLIAQPQRPKDVLASYGDESPVVRFGSFGAGRPVTESEELRELYAQRFNLMAYDAEFKAVIESIRGNTLQSYLLVRGIADYVDGRHGMLNWQAYAALSAAAFMRSVIMELPST